MIATKKRHVPPRASINTAGAMDYNITKIANKEEVSKLFTEMMNNLKILNID